MKRFICTREWKRTLKGAIVEHWEWRKFPKDIQEKHFQELQDEPNIGRISSEPTTKILESESIQEDLKELQEPTVITETDPETFDLPAVPLQSYTGKFQKKPKSL